MSGGCCCNLAAAAAAATVGGVVMTGERVTIDEVLGVMDLVVNARKRLKVATTNVFICNGACPARDETRK
jgi:hypothetical protein